MLNFSQNDYIFLNSYYICVYRIKLKNHLITGGIEKSNFEDTIQVLYTRSNFSKETTCNYFKKCYNLVIIIIINHDISIVYHIMNIRRDDYGKCSILSL